MTSIAEVLQNASAQPELRAYQPTWRDQLGAWLLGDQPSPQRRRMVRETVGSAGAGNSGLSLIDATPAGLALGGQEAVQEGDYPTAAAYGATAALPVAGPLVRGIVSAAHRAPKAASALVGGVLASAPTEAGSARLTQRQQREIEQQRQLEQARTEGEIARQRGIAEQARMAKEAEARLQLQIEQQRQEFDRATAEEQKRQAANMPFRERFPTLASTLPFAGAAAALAIPYAAKLGKTIAGNRAVGEWNRRVTAAEEALPTASRTKATQMANEMRAYKTDGAPDTQPSKALVATSAALPAEAALLPYEYDAVMLPPGNPDREAARSVLMDPIEIAKRGGVGLMQGLPMATVGAKLPSIIPPAVAPVAATEGLISAFDLARRQAHAPGRPRKRQSDRQSRSSEE